MARYTPDRAQLGLSLVEALIFIVILGVVGAAIVGVYGLAGRNMAELTTRFEAQRIAQSMIHEILARPARCDDNRLGPEQGETRATPYDHVNDYHGFDSQTAGGIRFPSGEAVDADGDGQNDLGGYRIQVRVGQYPLPPVPATDALRVIVSVTPPVGARVVLDALRVCYRT